MNVMTRDGLIDMLRHNVTTVTFTKVSGDERVMRCTLQADLIPNAPKQNGQVIIEQKTNANTIAVWDLDVSGWRSFRVDSVKKVSVG